MTKEQITELLPPYLEDDRIFIVEVKVGEGKNLNLIINREGKVFFATISLRRLI